MKCVNCDTPLHVRAADDSTQFARNTCRCEKTEKCYKGKCKNPVAQAELESDGETIERFRCAEHAIADLLDPSVPEAPPAPVAPTVVIPPLSKNPESRSGMQIEEQTYVTSKPVITKAMIIADVKADKYEVICMSCQKQHCHSKRKVLGTFLGTSQDAGKQKEGSFTIVCPFCEGLGYRIV